MAFLTKSREIILSQALNKLQQTTPITSIAPGSVMRSLAEVITSELGNIYTVIDFNFSMQLISEASGRALDAMGTIYNIPRKTLTNIAAIDASLGSFFFYIDSPTGQNIDIPSGTKIFTNTNDLIGETFTYETTQQVTLNAGRTRAYVPIRPLFSDSVYTAGAHTLTVTDFSSPIPSVSVKCTNPKAIQAQVGYETDDNYRVRLIKGIRTVGGGTSESMRLNALAVPGVRDASVRDAPYGLGSFELVVLPESGSNNEILIRTVRAAIDNVRPVGVMVFLSQPKYIPFSLVVELSLRSNPNTQVDNVITRVEISIQRYLNRLLIGEPLVYNHLVQAIFDASPDSILDVTFQQYRANGEEVIRKNYAPKANEVIVPGSVNVNARTV